MKAKAIRELSKLDREQKMKDLRLELVKAKANAAKSGSGNIRQIKKIIARMHTFNNSNQKEELKKK